MHYWGPVIRGDDPAGYKQAIDSAFSDYQAWKRFHKVHTSHRRFTFWGIFKDEYGCYFNSKGFNARVISEWLEDVLRQSLHQPPPGLIPDPRAQLCLVAMNLDRTINNQCPGFLKKTIDKLAFINPIKEQNINHFNQKNQAVFYCQPGTGINRYFGLTERASRFLMLGSQ